MLVDDLVMGRHSDIPPFLQEFRLQDLWPVINVCDKHDLIDEMVKFLFSNNQLRYLDTFLLQRNPLRTPVVIGALLDLDVGEDVVKKLVMSVGALCPVDPLVEEVEKRNRLKMLLGWLEARMNEGSQDPSVHNAIAKIYVDLHKDPEKFLTTDMVSFRT